LKVLAETTALAAPPVKDVQIEVEHDVVPFDWADVFQQGEIDSIGERVALTQDPGDFARLPVDDACQDQVQAAAGVHLLPQLAGAPLPPTAIRVSHGDETDKPKHTAMRVLGRCQS